VDFLAANGADINAWNHKNAWGWTPLLIAQGYREGNFRPDVATISALERIMLAAGVTPPEPGPEVIANQQSWDKKPPVRVKPQKSPPATTPPGSADGAKPKPMEGSDMDAPNTTLPM
jgi:hypothetical protein